MNSRTLISTSLLAGLAVTSFAGNVNTLDGSQGWGISDQRFTSTISIVGSPSNDGDGSLQLVDNANNERAAAAFSNASGNLGTLGDLAAGSMSFDYMRGSGSSIHQIAAKLYFTTTGGKTGSLNWEEVYNNGGNTEADGVWTANRGVGAENWWLRYNSTNYDTFSNFQSLSSWAGGYQTSPDQADVVLDSNTIINAVEFGAGSGWGAFTGYADHLNMQFGNGGASYNSNFQAVPEPASLACLGLGAIALIRRRKSTRA